MAFARILTLARLSREDGDADTLQVNFHVDSGQRFSNIFFHQMTTCFNSNVTVPHSNMFWWGGGGSRVVAILSWRQSLNMAMMVPFPFTDFIQTFRASWAAETFALSRPRSEDGGWKTQLGLCSQKWIPSRFVVCFCVVTWGIYDSKIMYPNTINDRLSAQSPQFCGVARIS